jgi:acetyl esterase/lipase
MRRRNFLASAFGLGASAAIPSWLQGAGYRKETFTYKRAGNLALQLDAYRPADERVVPVIVWIHGGALISGHRGNLRTAHLERYMTEGFAVVSIDYRLAPEVKINSIIEDVQDAFRWVRHRGAAQLRIDPTRLAVMGHSAGGYLTLMTGICIEPRPGALVSFYGYGDIAGEWYSRPDPFYSAQPHIERDEALLAVGKSAISEALGPDLRGRFYLYCRQTGRWPFEVAGHDPDKEPRAFDPYCPARNVTKQYPPTLLLHGDRDTDVPYQQSVQMAAELKRAGVEHELVTIPGGGHGFDGRVDDPIVAKAFERVLAFLQQHLKRN